jgi:hypothetical protein
MIYDLITTRARNPGLDWAQTDLSSPRMLSMLHSVFTLTLTAKALTRHCPLVFPGCAFLGVFPCSTLPLSVYVFPWVGTRAPI